jgi:hypothetical protein
MKRHVGNVEPVDSAAAALAANKTTGEYLFKN